ncbi:MAG: SDR family oxidoreductase [Chlorobiales bacterium]|nr:SDR family oxidoreductase [Chlorobiales bacterium]
MSSQFDGKVALVTGASSGIGRACALQFGREGAMVVVTDVSVEGGEETVRLIKAAKGEGFFFKCDVSNSKEVSALVGTTIETYGRLDCACNNAGIEGTMKPAAEYPEDVWNRVIAINLTGVWLCMKYEIPEMLKHGGGAIVNMASILGTVGFANASAYTAAKHGVVGLTKAAAIEYAAQGIRINAVCPAFIYTPMLERVGMAKGTDAYAAVTGLHPIKRMGTPEEIAEAVIWLCSNASSFVTGHAMLVDGGYIAQ